MDNKITCEIIVNETASVSCKANPAQGWGDDTKLINIGGHPLQIILKKNEELSVGIRIDELGRLHIVKYDGYFEFPSTNNLTLGVSK